MGLCRETQAGQPAIPPRLFIEPNPYMTTNQTQTTPPNGQTAKVGETYNRDRYEVHSRARSKGAQWRADARSATTLEEARAQVKEGQKPENPTLVAMIGAGPKLDFRIVQVKATCQVVE